MSDKLIYTLPVGTHDANSLKEILGTHPEIAFVSLVAVDIYGHDTDEKIPIRELIKDPDAFLKKGVQTDGSSVLLPLIADLSDGNVKLIPDLNVNWYVDYNEFNYSLDDQLKPVGTLRIPSYLIHNETEEVGSRVILRDSLAVFKRSVLRILEKNPYIFEYIDINDISEIKDIELTAATELEFYVKTPNEDADKERLHVAQELKEQYWKRTIGTVRTALETTIEKLELYGFNVEMGHKEVGGVSAKFLQGGDYDHVMEQLEIDWKYDNPMQAADNDYQIRYIIKDTFREFNLDVTFMAKPVEGAAGSGKHTHIGAVALLKDGRRVNLFAPRKPEDDYLSPIGFGSLMGILKNYEIINPIANCTSDALNRLKPGYEAPVCAVTSLGKSLTVPSRNRTVLLGLIRDPGNPAATRFELRSPYPKSNTYLVVAACLMAMLDGINAAVSSGKTPDDLLASISKEYGQEDFYLEKDRVYRTESNIFEDFDTAQREKLFGKTPQTVWENIKSFTLYPEKTKVLFAGGFDERDIESFSVAAKDQWTAELHNRIIPEYRETVKACCKRLHAEPDPLDDKRYEAVISLGKQIAKDSEAHTCMLTDLVHALDSKDYETAADLQIAIRDRVAVLEAIRNEYKKNIL